METKFIAAMLIAIIISIPFTIGAVTINTPDKQCDSKKAKAKALVDSMDNGVIKTLETVSSLLYMLCTVASAIDLVLNIIATIIGLVITPAEKPAATPTATAASPPVKPPENCCQNYLATCKALGPLYNSWKSVYKKIEPFCCLVSCGWCTGQGCADLPGGLNIGGYGSFGLGSAGSSATSPGINLHLSPYENIYIAAYCLCPTAILFNLRKLKTIYQVYNCCVEQACQNGISTEVCDHQLDVATCMYFEGSFMKSLVKIAMSLIVGYVFKAILKINLQDLLPKCFIRFKDLAAIPTVISNVMTAWSWFSTTISDPQCKDLGFDKLKKQIKEAPSWVPGTFEDTNKDGVKDKMQTKPTVADKAIVSEGQPIKPAPVQDELRTPAPVDAAKLFGSNEVVTKENVGSSGGRDLAVTTTPGQPKENPNEQKANDLVWMLFDLTLGSFAYGQIDKMCESKWTASEPEK